MKWRKIGRGRGRAVWRWHRNYCNGKRSDESHCSSVNYGARCDQLQYQLRGLDMVKKDDFLCPAPLYCQIQGDLPKLWDTQSEGKSVYFVRSCVWQENAASKCFNALGWPFSILWLFYVLRPTKHLDRFSWRSWRGQNDRMLRHFIIYLKWQKRTGFL